MLENREYCKRVADEIERYTAGGVVNDDGENLNLWDYLTDVLDYDFTVDSRKEYRSARIWVSLGGPNVWIDTADRAVKLAWGTDRAEYPIDSDVCDEIDDVMREIYDYAN